MLHRIIAPKSKLPKVYLATLAQDCAATRPWRSPVAALLLEGERTPLLPAGMEAVDAHTVRLTLHEGRYHQVRRMFAAVGNHVEALHRERVGGLTLGDLPAGEWRKLGDADRALLFAST